MKMKSNTGNKSKQKLKIYKPSTGAPARTEDNTLGIPKRMSALLAFKG
jgi:hypothetical protein